MQSQSVQPPAPTIVLVEHTNPPQQLGCRDGPGVQLGTGGLRLRPKCPVQSQLAMPRQACAFWATTTLYKYGWAADPSPAGSSRGAALSAPSGTLEWSKLGGSCSRVLKLKRSRRAKGFMWEPNGGQQAAWHASNKERFKQTRLSCSSISDLDRLAMETTRELTLWDIFIRGAKWS